MRNIFTTLLAVMIINVTYAGEGMWLPLFLKSLNEGEMKEMGMRLTAEDIYSVNKGSLKDAIVHFGGFCTSEIISRRGLLLTNHHCGYGQIQSHTTLENNYLKNGFWAFGKDQELMNEGLTATLINEIVDITSEALLGIADGMSDSERQAIIDINLESVRKELIKEDYQDIVIRPFFYGNQYFAFLTTTYRDVRLVGAPPESIGKFGADTDNWVWPRHTGDFALFRIYAGPDNLPADPSPKNKPFRPKHHLPISLDGVDEGDFTMVFGFPGRTQEYLPAVAVEEIVDVLDPAKIGIREKTLNILDKYMRTDEATRIRYASKFARIANSWKKWIGEVQGLTRTKAVEKKKKAETEFLSRLPRDSEYRGILDEFDKLYKQRAPYAYARDYYSEVTGRNIELMRLAGIAQRMVGTYENNGVDAYQGYKARVIPFLEGFYKDYDAEIDKEVFAALTEMYAQDVDHKYTPGMLESSDAMQVNYKHLADDIYSGTVFTDQAKIFGLLDKNPEEVISTLKSDPLYELSAEWQYVYNKEVAGPYDVINDQIDSLQRIYMKALMETFSDNRFYPDANSTMRITYGKVEGYSPKDGHRYTPVTYLEGVMEKYKPGDYEFDVDQKLIDLYEAKDYGRYADKKTGKMPVCFIGTNHSTGGNSGSPAIDAWGNLVGINFDRTWEGTMSDLNYDPSICRNIMTDARYIVFVIDKYAGAVHLLNEMTLVNPKNAQIVKDAKGRKIHRQVHQSAVK